MSVFFFFNDTATTEIYTLSLHDALPISASAPVNGCGEVITIATHDHTTTRYALAHKERAPAPRSEEHTSELQSHLNLVCRLLLEKKKKLQEISRVSTK